MKKMLITILMTLLLIVVPLSWANAALLNVTIKTDSIQIPSAGSTGMTVTVKTGTGLPVGGAALAFTATPAACAAPTTATPITNVLGMNSTPITFTGPATASVIVCKITITATSGMDSGTATVSIIVGKGYVPLVPIPGVGTPTSFPAYLVGLYKLALISIAIFAMMMILYGGFKYMTSAGNPALMGDAKDAIWSAIFGLILALISWLILSTVNPELTMIKTPGTSISVFTPSASTPRVQCAQEDELTSPKCNCIDGAPLSNPTGQTCNSLCSANNCLVARLRMGVFTPDEILTVPIDTLRSRSTQTGTKDFPFYVDPDNGSCNLLWEGEYFSTIYNKTPPPVYDWDSDYNGTWDGFNSPFLATCPIFPLTATPPCYETATPKAIICPLKFKITDGAGKTKEDVLYWGTRIN